MHATFIIFFHHFTNVIFFYVSLTSPRSPIPITKSTCILKLVCTQSQEVPKTNTLHMRLLLTFHLITILALAKFSS